MTGATLAIRQQHLCGITFWINVVWWTLKNDILKVLNQVCDGCVKWSQPSEATLLSGLGWLHVGGFVLQPIALGHNKPILCNISICCAWFCRLQTLGDQIPYPCIIKFELSSWIMESMNTMLFLFLMKRDDLYEACLAYPYVPLCWMNSSRQILVFCSLNIWYAQKESLRILLDFFPWHAPLLYHYFNWQSTLLLCHIGICSILRLSV